MRPAHKQGAKLEACWTAPLRQGPLHAPAKHCSHDRPGPTAVVPWPPPVLPCKLVAVSGTTSIMNKVCCLIPLLLPRPGFPTLGWHALVYGLEAARGLGSGCRLVSPHSHADSRNSADGDPAPLLLRQVPAERTGPCEVATLASRVRRSGLTSTELLPEPQRIPVAPVLHHLSIGNAVDVNP